MTEFTPGVPYDQETREVWHIFGLMKRAIDKHTKTTSERKQKIRIRRYNRDTREFLVSAKLPWGWRQLSMMNPEHRQLLLELCPTKVEEKKLTSKAKKEYRVFILLRGYLADPPFKLRQMQKRLSST